MKIFTKMAAVVLACVLAVDDYRLRNQLYPVNVCYNLYLAFERDAASVRFGRAAKNLLK